MEIICAVKKFGSEKESSLLITLVSYFVCFDSIFAATNKIFVSPLLMSLVAVEIRENNKKGKEKNSILIEKF